MSTAYLTAGKTERITVFGTNGATKVTGSTWTLKIVRQDNGQFWNGSAFQAGVTTVNMTEASAANRPGEYFYDFTPPSNGYVCSVIAETTDAAVGQKIHTGTISVGYGLPRDAEQARKYIRNKTVLSAAASGTYTVYEDDEVTTHETGTFTSTERNPA